MTSFLATGLPRPEKDLAELCRCAVRYAAAHNGESGYASCLGVHLEGPFFNPKMAGVQNPAYLRKPDVAFVDRLNALAPVRKVFRTMSDLQQKIFDVATRDLCESVMKIGRASCRERV